MQGIRPPLLDFGYICVVIRAFRYLLLAAVFTVTLPAFAYNDHRGHNLDSLERVVARWTPDKVDRASLDELIQLNRAYRNLMLGWHVLNGEKTAFYAHKALHISEKQQWMEASYDANRYLGQYFYSNEVYDSAKVYYLKSLACVDAMAAGATSPTNPDGYSQKSIDDAYSSLYGSLGNLYNMMDSIPQAMAWYGKAGEIFEKNGWNESNSVLWYNIGETWVDEGDLQKASEAYQKALGYAEASGDSLMIVDAWKGLGRMYAERGKTHKALPYLRKAEAYYTAHPKEAPNFRTENLEYLSQALNAQKKEMIATGAALLALALLAGGLFLALRRRRVKLLPADAQDQAAGEGADAAISNLPSPELTAKEKEILRLLAGGYTASQIAEALCLSNETIRWYRKKLLVKFDVANTPELISIAKDQKII